MKAHTLWKHPMSYSYHLYSWVSSLSMDKTPRSQWKVSHGVKAITLDSPSCQRLGGSRSRSFFKLCQQSSHKIQIVLIWNEAGNVSVRSQLHQRHGMTQLCRHTQLHGTSCVYMGSSLNDPISIQFNVIITLIRVVSISFFNFIHTFIFLIVW